jgi:hypothetical protein
MSSILAIVLQTIDNKTPIEKLFRYGIQYSQVFLLVNEALEQGYLVYGDGEEDDNLIVTETGRILIATSKNNFKGKAGWITPLDSEKIDSIGIGDIYVPSLLTIKKLKI